MTVPAEAMSMPTPNDTLKALTARLASFAAERDWNQFHNPKNLAMAVAGEVGELVEHFQWLTFDEAANLPEATREEVALEAADVLLFLLRLCDKLDIDLAAAAERKLELNARKYPVSKARGRATKYDKL
jgi:NTP pyrophosphatase (non-canonical NTP hydrolase)